MRQLAVAALAVLAVACASEPGSSTRNSTTTATSQALPDTTTLVTTTTLATTTTIAVTSTSSPAPVCRPDPFAGDVAATIAEAYPNQLISAHVHDLRTGCDYSLNPANRQRTASVLKVMVMAGTLFEAQQAGREVTDWELGQLQPMIAVSANTPVRNLWRSFGGSPWFTEQAGRFGLDQTDPVGDDGRAWGLTTTSARDQVDLLRQVLIGEWGLLDSDSRALAHELMTSVVPEQTWGVTAGVPEDWVVAQKNGFAGITINSVGWVDEPGHSPGYVVAILSQGWPNHPTGIAAVEEVSELVAAQMID